MDWTECSLENFLSRIRFDFITQIDKKLESMGSFTQADLAKRLNKSEGYVSQVLNNPPNLTLKTIVSFARAVGLKIAIVAYDDSDPDNNRGLINSEIFSACWEKQGKPADFFELEEKDSIEAKEVERRHNLTQPGTWQQRYNWIMPNRKPKKKESDINHARKKSNVTYLEDYLNKPKETIQNQRALDYSGNKPKQDKVA